SPSDNISDTVRSFLTGWYVQQNIDNLNLFIALDNAVSALSSEGILPRGTKVSGWSNLFFEAFTERPPFSVHISSLSDVIEYREPPGSRFSYINDPSRDHFAVINPSSVPDAI